MKDIDTIVASFADHPAAETAIKELASAGFDMKNLSVVGKGYHSDEKIMGFYNAGDRIKFWEDARRFLGRLLGAVLRWPFPHRTRGGTSPSCSVIWPR